MNSSPVLMQVENAINIEYLTERLKEKSPVLVSFQNSTCEICQIRARKLTIILSTLNEGVFKDLILLKVDTANSHFDHYNSDLHISTHPTIIIFKEQKEMFRFNTIQNFEYLVQQQL